ncbi:Ca2+-dependent phosphoinositide-specific phospholipase C [Puia sp. P3]|uniref:Ca2+-dependent phosphoinositide-specific phospholipase C n=1 Tax=Puia sp. P3 TaxID=3423952 RepID=UPI003D67EA82
MKRSWTIWAVVILSSPTISGGVYDAGGCGGGGALADYEGGEGKFIFILDEGGEHRASYIQNHPSLKGRVLFTDSPAGTPEAAFMIMNNPKDEQIKEMVKKGYMVRTRADSDTKEARANDRSGFLAACASGAQIITTDYYYKSSFFVSDYSVVFEDGKYVRKQP